MADKKRIDEPTGTETVGHEWDGIEELDTPMPRWWLWTFYLCIAWALGYAVMYPSWPLLNGATKGITGWTSRGQLADEMKAEADRTAPVRTALAGASLEQIAADPNLLKAAQAGGFAAFKVHCVQCHGTGAAGSKGYPNLNDDDWLWGGDLETIHYTITNGIRNPNHDQTRFSQMPAFGRDGILQPNDIALVTAYVRTISGQQPANNASRQGAAIFAANCAVCHGPDGKGMRSQGAPNLTDKIWLYGGDTKTITQTITNSRFGVMPRWNNRLDAVTIKMLATYVHSLGGGEIAPPVEPAAKTDATALDANAQVNNAATN